METHEINAGGAPNEATLVIIKPDGIQKSLTGNVISRLSETRLKIVAAKMKSVTREDAEAHYAHLREKPFFEEVILYIMGTFHTPRVLALVYYGPHAVDEVRRICGSTNPEKAEPYTLRGSYGRITTEGVYENVVHASSSAEDARREIKLWFTPDEITVQELFPTRVAPATGSLRVWAE